MAKKKDSTLTIAPLLSEIFSNNHMLELIKDANNNFSYDLYINLKSGQKADEVIKLIDKECRKRHSDGKDLPELAFKIKSLYNEPCVVITKPRMIRAYLNLLEHHYPKPKKIELFAWDKNQETFDPAFSNPWKDFFDKLNLLRLKQTQQLLAFSDEIQPDKGKNGIYFLAQKDSRFTQELVEFLHLGLSKAQQISLESSTTNRFGGRSA